MYRAWILLSVIALSCTAAQSEVLVMRSGRVVDAHVLRQTPRLITIRSGDGSITLPRSAVRSVLDESQFDQPVETQRYPNDPPPTRQALMEGTYEPSAQEKLATAMLKLKQSGRDYRFFSSVPRSTPSRYQTTFTLGPVVVHQAPPPYVVPPWWYGGWGHRHHHHGHHRCR